VHSTIKLHVLRVKAICDKSVTLDQHKTCWKCAVGARELQKMLSALRRSYFAHSWHKLQKKKTASECMNQESPTCLKLHESYFVVQINAKGYQFDTHSSEIKICSICLQLRYH